MAETEKITINMNVVDLGKVDLLVEQGFYTNRTDFIKTAIRNQLTTHAKIVDDATVSSTYVIGVSYFNRKSLLKALEEKKKLRIKVLGMLVLDEDIEPELALNTIKSIKVLGTLRASRELKKVLEPIIK